MKLDSQTCDRNHATLAAYLDGELPPEQTAALDQHIRTCPACAAEIASLVRLKRTLLRAHSYFAPTTDFKSRIQRQITPPRRRGWLPAFAAALATTAILVIALIVLHQPRRPDPFSEIADLHVNALATSAPLDVVSTDRHTVKPWFEGRIPFSFNVPELAGTSYTLLGAKLVYLNQQPTAQLLVGLRQHKISVLVFQQSGALSFPDGAFARNSFAEESWQSHDLRFVVIGDIPPADLEALSQTFKDANR